MIPVDYGLGIIVVDIDVPRGPILQVVDLKGIWEGDLGRAECYVYVRNLYYCFGILFILGGQL